MKTTFRLEEEVSAPDNVKIWGVKVSTKSWRLKPEEKKKGKRMAELEVVEVKKKKENNFQDICVKYNFVLSLNLF